MLKCRWVFHYFTVPSLANLPTAVTLTVALCPVPTVLIGTQVYTPSALTVTMSTPELLLPIRMSLK